MIFLFSDVASIFQKNTWVFYLRVEYADMNHGLLTGALMEHVQRDRSLAPF